MHEYTDLLIGTAVAITIILLFVLVLPGCSGRLGEVPSPRTTHSSADMIRPGHSKCF